MLSGMPGRHHQLRRGDCLFWKPSAWDLGRSWLTVPVCGSSHWGSASPSSKGVMTSVLSQLCLGSCKGQQLQLQLWGRKLIVTSSFFPSKVPGQALKHIRLEVHENASVPALSLPPLTLLCLIIHSDKQKADNLKVLKSCEVWWVLEAGISGFLLHTRNYIKPLKTLVWKGPLDINQPSLK